MTRAGITPVACLLLVAAVAADGAAAQEGTGCEVADGGERTGVVRGRVTDAETGVPLRGADVVLSWRERGNPQPRQLEVEADTAGTFTFCGAPLGESLMVQARFAGESSRGEAVQFRPDGSAEVAVEVDSPHARILGRVIETETARPIASAEVALRGTPLRNMTVSDGTFSFPTVPPGGYDLTVSHIGYQSVRDSIRLELGTNMQVTVHLGVAALPHAPIEVTVRSLALERAGFYERQEHGLGDYITRDAIDERVRGLASELLQGLPGVRLVPREDGFGSVPLGRGNCPFRYVMDGTRVGPGFEIDDISPSWIEALEIYRGQATIPPQFAPMPGEYRARCGLIVIWTRSGR